MQSQLESWEDLYEKNFWHSNDVDDETDLNI
jgi:hypothetical protein